MDFLTLIIDRNIGMFNGKITIDPLRTKQYNIIYRNVINASIPLNFTNFQDLGRNSSE